MAQSSAAIIPLFVAAIDLGTTYSGYAFSSKDEYAKEPLKIHTYCWDKTYQSLQFHKTPTALLLNPDKTFNSFGLNAVNNYCKLNNNDDSDNESEKTQEDLYQKYYFFHRSKMLLHNKVLRRDTMIAEETGKTLPAKIVFTESIRYLKDHLLQTITKQYPEIKKEEINYVLTVPAILDDAAKQFMREAATEAGIPDNQLLMVLEPEAASILCQLMQAENEGTELVAAQAGTKYLVADLGGTAKTIVHEKQFDDTLKELRPASGGPWGGIAVDDAFIAFMSEICGAENIEIFKEQSMEDYFDFFYREFEIMKRTFSVSDPTGNVTITLPYGLIQIIEKNRKGLKESISLSKYADKVICENERIQIPNPVFASLFEPTINEIINHINSILDEHQFENLDRIFMVGGFSDCELVQEAFNKEFKEKKGKKIIVPDEAGLAVLQGAVLFGHKPTSIG